MSGDDPGGIGTNARTPSAGRTDVDALGRSGTVRLDVNAASSPAMRIVARL